MEDTDLANAAPEVALILAAGLGSRLRAQTKTPKPLTRVLGLTLADRRFTFEFCLTFSPHRREV